MFTQRQLREDTRVAIGESFLEKVPAQESNPLVDTFSGGFKSLQENNCPSFSGSVAFTNVCNRRKQYSIV